MDESSTVFQKVSSRTKWTFTLGGIGRDMAYNLWASYLLAFTLLTKNIDDKMFATVSIVLVVCRIWDAINDPVMGGIIENTRSKWGKFKPWILIGAITNSVVLIVTFTVPLKGWDFVIGLIFFYLLWDITYTMNDIGYWSMLPSLTSDAKDRSMLASMANLFAAVGAIAALGLIPILTAGGSTIGGSAVTAYKYIAVFIALAFSGCQIMTVFGVKENSLNLQRAEKIGVKKMIKVIAKNDQLLWIALTMVFYNFGSSLILAFGSIYVYFVFGYEGFYVTILTAAYAVSTILANIFYPKLAEKFSRKKIQFYSIVTACIGYVIFFLSGLIYPNIYIFAFALLIIGYGQITYYALLTISISNTVEYNEWRTGNRDESLIFAVRPFMAKLGSSLQQLAIMAVFLIVGVTKFTEKISEIENNAAMNPGLYTAETKKIAIENILSGVTGGMRAKLAACIAFIPILLLIASYIVIRLKYKIDEDFYEKMLKEIAEKRKA
jgi:sugar (Glycoside-Pentoside-Hexuronide) transporter